MSAEVWAAQEDEYETEAGWYSTTPELVLKSITEDYAVQSDANHTFVLGEMIPEDDGYRMVIESHIDFPKTDDSDAFKWDRRQEFLIFKIEVRTS